MADCRADFHKLFIAVSSLCYECHIIGSHILAVSIKARRVVKMAFCTAKALYLFIHHGYKSISAAGHMLRKSIGCLVTGMEDQRIEAVFYRKLVTCIHI